MASEFALVMAGAAAAHQAAAASRQGNGQQGVGRGRRSSGDPQRAQQGATAAAAAAPAALDSLSRLQQLADASPQVAQLRRLQALADASPQMVQMQRLQAPADSYYATVSQLAGAPEEKELLQGQFVSAELPPQRQQAPRANNTGLPDQLKSGIESLSGLSMDHVRVHFNSSQPAQLNALAYAQGSDIHLAPGQERHLPHEAWHVVQQAQGRVRPTLQMKEGVQVNDDVRLEREADVMGASALRFLPNSHVAPGTTDRGAQPALAEIRQIRPRPSLQQGAKHAALGQSQWLGSLFRMKQLMTFQRGIYNKPLGQLSANTLQLMTFKRDSKDCTGELTSSEEKGKIAVHGWIKKGGEEQKSISGSLLHSIDKLNSKRVIISTISVTPKNTGAGSVLMYLLANKAVDDKMDAIGTELSALEEGTTEFYRKLGFAPAINHANSIAKHIATYPEMSRENINKMLYSGPLDANPSMARELARQKLDTWKLITD